MDARKVVKPHYDVKVFTADGLAQHLAKGWTPDQLTSGRVAVLGAATHTVRCARGWRVKQLKQAVEDLVGCDKATFTLMQGRTIVTDKDAVHEGLTYIMLKDKTPEPGEAEAVEQGGGLRLRDPKAYGGSYTITQTEEEEKEDAARARRAREQQAAAAGGAAAANAPAHRAVDRTDILRALARRHGR